MTESNGHSPKVFTIGRKGLARFQMADEDGKLLGPPIELDVVAVQNLWAEIDRGFRDEKGEVPPERIAEMTQALWGFARQMLQCDTLTLTNANEFLKYFTEEGNRLARFFKIDLPDAPSSRASTDVTYSP